jgi:hypothetical protein
MSDASAWTATELLQPTLPNVELVARRISQDTMMPRMSGQNPCSVTRLKS